MALIPLSVQLEDKITLPTRERKSTATPEMKNTKKVMLGMAKAAALQASLGLGDPKAALETRKSEFANLARLEQAEKLASKFKAIKSPDPKFFPRFAREEGALRIHNMASTTVRGRLPEIVMAKLEQGIEKVYIRLDTDKGRKNYEAPIPVFPSTALELAQRAKEMAPDCDFHLLFMPSWEPGPQRDPVLVVNVKGTDEWFEVFAWDGDRFLIAEFLEDA